MYLQYVHLKKVKGQMRPEKKRTQNNFLLGYSSFFSWQIPQKPFPGGKLEDFFEDVFFLLNIYFHGEWFQILVMPGLVQLAKQWRRQELNFCTKQGSSFVFGHQINTDTVLLHFLHRFLSADIRLPSHCALLNEIGRKC